MEIKYLALNSGGGGGGGSGYVITGGGGAGSYGGSGGGGGYAISQAKPNSVVLMQIKIFRWKLTFSTTVQKD